MIFKRLSEDENQGKKFGDFEYGDYPKYTREEQNVMATYEEAATAHNQAKKDLEKYGWSFAEDGWVDRDPPLEQVPITEEERESLIQRKEAWSTHEEAKERLHEHGLRVAEDGLFERISQSGNVEAKEPRAEEEKPMIPKEVRNEEARINLELPENYVLRIDPLEDEVGAIVRMSADGGKTYNNYGALFTEQDIRNALFGLDGQSAVKHFHQKFPRSRN